MRPTVRTAATLAAAAIIMSACGESASDTSPAAASTVAPASGDTTPSSESDASTADGPEVDSTANSTGDSIGDSTEPSTEAAEAPPTEPSSTGPATDPATDNAGLPAENPLLTGVIPTVTGSQIDLASFVGQDVLVWVWAPW